MKRSDHNHLRRLIGWIRCEIGPSPEEFEATLKGIACKLGNPEIDAETKQRLVESHDKYRSVPKYVRDAVKALEKHLNQPSDYVEAYNINNVPDETHEVIGENGIRRDPPKIDQYPF